MLQIHRAHRLAVGTQLARTDLERAKLNGWINLRRPTGTSFTAGTTSRDGSTVVTASWSGATTYYSVSGVALAANAPASTRIFAVTRSCLDVDIVNGGSDYTINATGQRQVRTTVVDVARNETLVVMGTELIRGGV